jgi:hypothetical protein
MRKRHRGEGRRNSLSNSKGEDLWRDRRQGLDRLATRARLSGQPAPIVWLLRLAKCDDKNWRGLRKILLDKWDLLEKQGQRECQVAGRGGAAADTW